MIYIVSISSHNIDYVMNADFFSCNMNIKIFLKKIKKMIGRVSSFHLSSLIVSVMQEREETHVTTR